MSDESRRSPFLPLPLPLPPNPKQTSSRPKQPGTHRAHLLAVVATDGLIVRCVVERSLYFVFALPLLFVVILGICFVLLSLFVPLSTTSRLHPRPTRKSCQATKHPIHMQINNIRVA